jgi:hypothetical protein
MRYNTKLAIVINVIAVLWTLIFVKYTYAGIILGVSALVWFFIFLKKKQDKLEVDFQKRFSGKNIRRVDKTAVFKAQESHGYSQTQGMGYLILTDEELYFEMSLLNKVLSIPTASITRVGQTKRLKGVGTLRSMLLIEFMDDKGNKDSIALFVKEIELWKREIKNVISNG